MSKLDNTGRIPPRTPCPYRTRCEIALDGGCYHKGEAHEVAFSCAVARGFAIIERRDEPEPSASNEGEKP